MNSPTTEALRAWICQVHDVLSGNAGPASRIAWGPRTVSHKTTRPDWFTGMDAAWARPLPASGPSDVDLVTACFEDVVGVASPPQLRRGDLGARGEVTTTAGTDVRMVWDDFAGLVLAWDPASGKAICLIAEPPDGYELVSPLRTLVHWVVVAAGGLLMHTASVGRRESAGPARGALILGEAGYGKSTTTLACLQRGWVTCGDDAVALFRENGEWLASSVYAAVKTKLQSEHVHEWASEDIVTWEIAGTKRAHRLTATGRDLLIDRMVVDALIVLDPTAPREQDWQRVEGSRARTLAAPSTAIPLPFDRDVVLRRIGELCAGVPAYLLPRRAGLSITVEHVGEIVDDAQRRISVVIPVYNGTRFVADAIASITAQTDGWFEILAVDDGSGDDSAAVIEKLVPEVAATGNQLRLLRHERNKGIAAARNTGIRAATSGWIAFLDQDDLWPRDRARSLLETARATGADAVFGRMSFLDLGSDSRRPWMRREWFDADHRGHAMGAALVRRSVFDRIGMLDESNRTGSDDVDWIMRVRDSELTVIDTGDLALQRRIHESNTTASVAATSGADLLAVVRSHRHRMQKREPRLDVVIPAHNATAFIEASVRSALSQRGADARVIIVDDGSDDGLAELVASWAEPRITYLRRDRPRGAGAARNAGVAACRGDWLSFLDADDMWPYDRFQRLSAAAGQLNEMVLGHMLTFPDGTDPDPAQEHHVGQAPLAAIAGGILLRRELFERIGPFDEELRLGEFVDWMSRARQAGVKERTVETVSLLRRSHAANTTRTRRGEFSVYLDVVARARARQRAGLDG